MTKDACCGADREVRPDDDLVICRCEEVTKGEIREALAAGMASVSGVKRATRAGMGLCQGQTCGRLVAGLVARETGQAPADVEPMTARPPVRPIPMDVLAKDADGDANG
jgi:NAD(P)H-nitrite reductase large subunit